jgi:hypothetical protein
MASSGIGAVNYQEVVQSLVKRAQDVVELTRGAKLCRRPKVGVLT